MRLHVKFQVNRASVDYISKLGIFLTAKSRRALMGPQMASKLKQKLMIGPIYCSGSSTSNFRSFRQHLTRFWRLKAKSGLLAGELPGIMTFKSELMDRLRMTPIGSLSNFRSIGYRLTVHQSLTFSSRRNKVKHWRDPKRLQNSNQSPWLVLSTAKKTPRQILGQTDIVWPSFKARHFPHGEIKASICGTQKGFKTQTKAYGWSYLLLKKLHIEFQVIPTSFGLVSTLDKKSAIPHNKVFGFPEKWETLCSDLRGFSSGFL